MGITWKDRTPMEVMKGLTEEQAERMRTASFLLLGMYAGQLEAYMKKNGPWRDRTGNARRGLWAKATRQGTVISLRFGHSMWYGVNLEYGYQGRYAIIAPTLDHFLPLVMADLKKVLTKP